MGLLGLGSIKIEKINRKLLQTFIAGQQTEHNIYLLWKDATNCIEYNSQTGLKKDYVVDGLCQYGYSQGKRLSYSISGKGIIHHDF